MPQSYTFVFNHKHKLIFFISCLEKLNNISYKMTIKSLF